MEADAQAEYFALLERSFAAAPIIEHVPQTLSVIEEGRVRIELPFDLRLCHGGGALHGGVLMLLLDNAGYFACASASGGKWVSTVEMKTQLLESVKDCTLVAEGEVLKRGRHVIHARADAFMVVGERRVRAATALGTWTILPRAFR